MLECVRHLVENVETWHSEFLFGIYRLLGFLVKLDLSVNNLESCYRIAAIGMRTSDECVQQFSLKLLNEICMERPEVVTSQISPQLFGKLVDLMMHKNNEIHAGAMRFVS